MKKIFTPKFICVCGFIALAAAARFFTPLPNFTPIAAMALFGGAYLGKKSLSLILPLLALAISDFFIGTYDMITMSAVYGSFILTAMLGWTLTRKNSVVRTGAAALSSSIVFFLLTNFGTWMSGFCGYPMTGAGLLTCYEMAIPFFRYEVLGTMVYSAVFFGAFEWAKSRFPALA